MTALDPDGPDRDHQARAGCPCCSPGAADRTRILAPFLALAADLLRTAQDSEGVTAVVYRQNADRIRMVAAALQAAPDA
jgi:hypothetical protein